MGEFVPIMLLLILIIGGAITVYTLKKKVVPASADGVNYLEVTTYQLSKDDAIRLSNELKDTVTDIGISKTDLAVDFVRTGKPGILRFNISYEK